MSTPPSPVPLEHLLQHRPWVRALARRLVGDAGLDDVEQQTWLAALRSPPRTGGSVRGWLATVVRNAARKRHRSQVRRSHHEQAAPRAADVTGPDQVVAEAETQQAVVQAVLALDEPYRTTLLLRFFEDLPHRDIAVRMDTNVETVRTRTRRALARLRKDLADRYGDRRALRLALIPLAARTGSPPPSGTAAPAAASAASGGALGVLALTTAKKLLLAAAALLAAVGAGLYALDDATPASTTTTTTTTAAAPGARDATRRGPRRDRDRATTAPSDARDGGDVGADTAHGDDAPGARLELEVLARDGGRLGSGLVVLFAQSGAFRTTWVAGAGTASIESLALDGLRLVLAWPGRPPQVRAVPDGAVRMSVQIADGSTVAGRVRVDGLAPQDPVRLALVALEAPWLERSALPDAVWEELGRHGFGPHEVPLTTGPGGTFRAATPTATGTAFVAIREGHLRGRDGERSFPAEVPTTVLDLDLVSLPAVTGRVVDADGAPVPGARVALVYAESGIAGTRQSDAGPDGRFLVAAHTVEITTAVLTVGASRPGARRLPVEGLRPGVRELGDVALEAERTLRLLVTDPRGRPIAGARCDAGDGATTGATDTRGALDLVLRASTDRVRVRAAGYAAQMADVPSGDAADWTVRLEPAPHVRVSVAEPPPGVRLILHLSAASALFDTDDGGFDRVLAAAGAVEPIEHGTDGAGRWSAAFVLPAAGSLDLHGLRPGTVVTYGIEDELGGLHPERPAAVPTQGAGAVVLPLTGSARRVVGRVLDPAGEPVVGAEVVLRHPGTTGFCRTVPTLPDGSFDGGIVLSDSVSVLVEQEGYAPALRDALPVPAEGSLETLRLAKGRTVRIEVCDPDGAPVDADGVEVVRPEGRLPQMRWFAEPGTRAGRHTARDLTLEDLVVLVEVRGRTVSVPCPVDADTVRVTVPE